MVRPIVKWVGGKRQLLGEILPLVPQGVDRYVEPFVGGGAVLFALQPTRARICDANSELINLYKVVRDDVNALVELLKAYEAVHCKELYYGIRGLDRRDDFSSMDSVERAARFMYLNHTCYNGMWRVNRSGQFNVPYGKYANPVICDSDNLFDVSRYLKSVEIVCGNYEDALDGLSRDDFVYFDPPYVPLSSTSSFTSYTQSGFSHADQVRLRDVCCDLRSRGVRLIQSNSDCDEIRDLYRGWDIRVVGARRSVNSQAAGRGSVNEVLILGL